jgi:RHS repeat-associated protein
VMVYYHQDAIGSVRVVTDANGGEVRRHDFLPFGQDPPGYTNDPAESFQFAGHQRDGATGADYFGARYYTSFTERFSTPDPWRLTLKRLLAPHTLNRYTYAGNNPLRYIDPTGLDYAIAFVDGDELIGFLPGDFAALQGWASGVGLALGDGNLQTGYLVAQTEVGPRNLFSYSRLDDPFDNSPTQEPESNPGGQEGGGASPAAAPPNQCFAELKYRTVDDARAKWLGLFRTHAFWYVQGSDSKPMIISGGPDVKTGMFLNSYPRYDIGPSAGPDKVTNKTKWRAGPSTTTCGGVDAMITAAKSWPNDTIRYGTLGGPNSNTFAGWLGAQGGFKPNPPPRSMAWGTQITIP